MVEGEADFRRLIARITDTYKVGRLITLGPSDRLLEEIVAKTGDGSVELVDSISMDPLLRWFWRESAGEPHLAI